MTTQKVQLSLKATKLKNVAGAFKGISDPFAVVTILPQSRDAKPRIIGKTEVHKNTLSPDWVKTFFLDYELGTPVSILIKIFDEVKKGENIEMGSCVFELGAILGAKGNTKAKSMKKGGTLFARVEKAMGSGMLALKMSGLSLVNTEGFMKKSDPFYQFTRKDIGHRGTEWNIVHRSDKIKNDLNPKWPEETIDLSILCGGDVDKNLRLGIYDYESSGKHVLMGEYETTVSALCKLQNGTVNIVNKKGKSGGKIAIHKAMVSGVESLAEEMAKVSISEDLPAPVPPPAASAPEPAAPPVASAPVFAPAPVSFAPPAVAAPFRPPPIPFTPPPRPSPTFVDYVQGGCEVSLAVAIDFTGSNGDPRQPGTLHYLSPDRAMNDYEKAIMSIGSLLAKYDDDQKFPVWGFGAKYSGQVYHLFQCGPKAEADGMKGVLDHYHHTFQTGLVMSGPTVITEVIQTAAAFAKSGQQAAARVGKQKYTTLLILTDGAVADVNATVQSLVTVSDAPLSIVIVGIGSADFSGMQFLDDVAINRGVPDLVQFVEYNRYRHNPSLLVKETLAEIPDQLVGYFTRNNIMPNPPVRMAEQDIVIEPDEEEIDLAINFGGDGDIHVGAGTAGVYRPPAYY